MITYYFLQRTPTHSVHSTDCAPDINQCGVQNEALVHRTPVSFTAKVKRRQGAAASEKMVFWLRQMNANLVNLILSLPQHRVPVRCWARHKDQDFYRWLLCVPHLLCTQLKAPGATVVKVCSEYKVL